tara:strand:- start:2425 stop:3024 length:600 start_codon:yes stop_codon:yes gene_type:complete
MNGENKMKKLLLTMMIMGTATAYAGKPNLSKKTKTIKEIKHSTCRVVEFSMVNELISIKTSKDFLREKGYEVIETETMQNFENAVAFADEANQGLKIMIGAFSQGPQQIQIQTYMPRDEVPQLVTDVQNLISRGYEKVFYALEDIRTMGHKKVAYVQGEGLEEGILNSKKSLKGLGKSTTTELKNIAGAMALLPNCVKY